ncbi:MAG: DUF5335 family protein [Rhodospirillaceae bacterium]
MPARDIARNEWSAFLDSFSRQHHGWLSTVEVGGREAGRHAILTDQPLTGITADFGAGERAMISILVGGTPGQHATHAVADVANVRVIESESGAHEALEIRSQAGDTTVIRFRASVPAELLDGFFPE